MGRGKTRHRKVRPKTPDQRKHALRRARERFDLDERDVIRIESMIQENRSTFIEAQSNRVRVHEVEYEGVVMHVCYDLNRRQAITFLHPEGNPLGDLP